MHGDSKVTRNAKSFRNALSCHGSPAGACRSGMAAQRKVSRRSAATWPHLAGLIPSGEKHARTTGPEWLDGRRLHA